MHDTNPAHASPADATSRALSIDALRGFAILGILPVNIQYFGMGLDRVTPDPQSIDVFVRSLVAVLFESKFISTFSLLFGAGIVLMDRSAQRRAQRWTGRYLRRTGILLVMGIIHAYLLWYGDILYTYALIGFAVFWLRRLTPKWLLTIGGGIYVLGLVLTGWLVFLQATAFEPGVEFDAARASFSARVELYAPIAQMLQTFYFVIYSAWFNTGLMILGMALAKLGFFEGRWSTRAYALIGSLGPLLTVPAIAIAQTTVPYDEMSSIAWSYTNLALAPVLALGYASLVILACTRVTPNILTRALAAIGRTALSNYLLQSVLCVFIFYGGLGGLGLIGRYNDATVHAIGLVIWLVQLVISPLWLGAFRSGPFEWAWRSLTYWRPQPMIKKRPDPST